MNRLLWDLWVDEIKWKEKYISRGQYIVIGKRRGRGRGWGLENRGTEGR